MKTQYVAVAVLFAALLGGAGCSSTSDDTTSMSDDGMASGDSMDSGTLANCPAGTTVTTLTSTDASVVEGGPFDASTFTYAKAKMDGNRLKVFISNEDYSVNQIMGLSTPVAGADKGTGILGLVFSNGTAKADVAAYDPAAGYGQPHWVTAEMFVPVGETGTDAILSMNSGTAEVVAMNDKTVCGTFDLTSAKSTVKGTFVASL